MTYREDLQKRIRELEQQILSSHGEKLELELRLQQLRVSEFEEEMREMNIEQQQLLKG